MNPKESIAHYAQVVREMSKVNGRIGAELDDALATIKRLTDEMDAQDIENGRLEQVRFMRLDNMGDAMKRAHEVARAHPHADTCATELSPNGGYPCSCWRGDLIVALTMPAEDGRP